MVAFARFPASELPKSVGDDANGRRRSDGRAGHLCHGPYLTLGPGYYTAGFRIRRDPASEEGEIEVEACSENGRRVFASRSTPVKDLFASVDGLVPLDFALNAVERGCELRLFVPAHARVEVTEALVFRRDLSDWGRR